MVEHQSSCPGKYTLSPKQYTMYMCMALLGVIIGSSRPGFYAVFSDILIYSILEYHLYSHFSLGFRRGTSTVQAMA